MQRARKLVLIASPSALLFLFIVYVNLTFNQDFSLSSDRSVAWYLIFRFSTPESALLNTLGFMLFCYLPMLPLIFLGARRLHNVHFRMWVMASLILVVIAVVFPIYNPVGYRWILMLVFPLSFYATEGLLSMKRRVHQVAAIIVFAFLTLSFVFLPTERAFPYYTAYLHYVPSSMLSNTVSMNDSPDTLNVLTWAESHVDKGSRLLTHDAFYGWATLVFSQNHLFRYGYEDPESAAEKVLQQGQTELYLIWWIEEGWHGLATVPASFQEVYHSGNIGLYKYVSQATG